MAKNKSRREIVKSSPHKKLRAAKGSNLDFWQDSVYTSDTRCKYSLLTTDY